jgi:hypothetical protein
MPAFWGRDAGVLAERLDVGTLDDDTYGATGEHPRPADRHGCLRAWSPDGGPGVRVTAVSTIES